MEDKFRQWHPFQRRQVRKPALIMSAARTGKDIQPAQYPHRRNVRHIVRQKTQVRQNDVLNSVLLLSIKAWVEFLQLGGNGLPLLLGGHGGDVSAPRLERRLLRSHFF